MEKTPGTKIVETEVPNVSIGEYIWGIIKFEKGHDIKYEGVVEEIYKKPNWKGLFVRVKDSSGSIDHQPLSGENIEVIILKENCKTT